jgi:hypothetical protein
MLKRPLIRRLALLACAAAFSLVPAASQGTPACRVICGFSGGADGGSLNAALFDRADGTVSEGGVSGAGIVFAFDP